MNNVHFNNLFQFFSEGNVVHTVHLWQPSGNRLNKLKCANEKTKKPPSRKRNKNTEMDNNKSCNKKITATSPATPCSTKVIPEELNVQQYHTQAQCNLKFFSKFNSKT